MKERKKEKKKRRGEINPTAALLGMTFFVLCRNCSVVIVWLILDVYLSLSHWRHGVTGAESRSKCGHWMMVCRWWLLFPEPTGPSPVGWLEAVTGLRLLLSRFLSLSLSASPFPSLCIHLSPPSASQAPTSLEGPNRTQSWKGKYGLGGKEKKEKELVAAQKSGLWPE